MMITLNCEEVEFAEHLYYAHIGAKLTLSPASVDIAWEDLPAVERRLWRCTAARLIAIHSPAKNCLSAGGSDRH
jgi:hypothetical protein